VATATFRFYAELNDFLRRDWRHKAVEHAFDRRTSLKDMIEALGVPHPEVAFILVNGRAAGFAGLVRDGDRVAVYPVFRHLFGGEEGSPGAGARAERFILDANLGALARHLRLCGFDAHYDNAISDDELARLAHAQDRVVLTRDRGALKRRLITHGYFVRAVAPRDQLAEVFRRFDLYRRAAPLTRCARCNGTLVVVDKAAIWHRLEPLTRQYFDEFRECQACGQLYWRGSHVRGIERVIEGIHGGRRSGPSS
jgi:uncharacterized protein with PIN domain